MTKRIKMFIRLIRIGKISLFMSPKEMSEVLTMYLTFEYLKDKKYEDIMK